MRSPPGALADNGPVGLRLGFFKSLTVPFKSVLLGAVDAGGETNLAAHRCSNFL
jgi:hypothetical protein